MKNKGKIAITEIFLLVVAIFAFSWMVGGFGVVSGNDPVACESAAVGGNCIPKGESCDGKIFSNGLCESDSWGDSRECCVPEKEKQTTPEKIKNVGNTVSNTKDAVEFGKDSAEKIKNIDVKKEDVSTGGETKPDASATSSAGFLAKYVGGAGLEASGLSLSGVSTALVWAGVAFLAGRYVLGPLFGLNLQQSQALGYALAAGTAAGIVAADIIGTGAAAGGAGGPAGVVIGVVVAAITFVAIAKKSSVDVVQVGCYQWDAQPGGENCELCNKNDDLPCTEYQCASLGQDCVLDNGGNCVWDNPNDIDPPRIRAWEEALLDDFEYNPHDALGPEDRGVYIEYTGAQKTETGQGGQNCVPAFKPISLGVTLDEPAKCKISPIRTPSYEETADYYIGRGIRAYNHSYSFSLPSAASLEEQNITIDPGQTYEMYVRCQDNNGNTNPGSFVFEFCVDDSPDITPPEIVTTSILDKHPIGFGQKNVSLDLFVRDASFFTSSSSCKWSKLDKSYESMENNMSCSTEYIETNGQLLYQCSTTLTGLKDRVNNEFYFRCIDDEGNANTESYLFNLVGTQALVIDSVGPQGLIKDSTTPIKVTLEAKTSAGYSEGKAACSFSLSGEEDDYVKFVNTNSFEHSQELWLDEGDYEVSVKCVDLGGNTDTKTADFTVQADTEAPVVVRAFKEENDLKIITDEEAQCVYSNFGCTYEIQDGTPMTSFNEITHTTNWNTDSDFYIKCKDNFDNQPLPNECSIVARPFEIFEVQEQ